MSAEPCRVCGKLRKVDIVFDSNGWQQPSCIHCGDPGYYEPFESPPSKELTYFEAGELAMAKTVPLVVYLDDGTRKVVGEAVVNDDGTIEGKVNDEEFGRKFEDGSSLYSLSVGPSVDGSPEAAVVEPSPIQRMDIREKHRLKIPMPSHPEIPRIDPTPITMQLNATDVIAEGDWYIHEKVRELVEANPQVTRPHISIEENPVTNNVKIILSQGPTMQPKEPDAKSSDNT